MSTNSPINGIRIPELSDTANIVNAVGQAVTDIDSRLMPRFATPAARDLAIASPVGGMICWVTSYNLPMVYYTSYWGFFPGTPLATLYQSVSQNMGDGVHQNINFDSEDYDLTGAHSTTVNPERYTANIPGRYLFHGGVSFAQNGTGVRATSFFKNGASPTGVLSPETVVGAASPTFHTIISVTGHVTLNGTTDYVTIYGYQNSGSTLATQVSFDNVKPTMHVTYMGPS